MNTYLFKSKWFKDIDKYFQERGNWKIYDPETDKELTFLYVDGPFIYEDKSHYTLNPKIKNLVDTNKYNIADKNKLYENMQKYYPDECKKFMMEQHFITKKNYTKITPKIFGTNIWILKPIKSHSGIGIKIMTNYTQYDNYIKNYNKQNKIQKTGWVLAKYIQNPLLFRKRKFHLRVYFLYNPPNNGYILKFGKFFPAKQEFKTTDYSNTDIHDTHYTEYGFFIFPNEFEEEFGKDKWDIVFKQILELGNILVKLMENVNCYAESKYCYEIFGCDIMILNNYKIKVIEINDKVGYGCNEPKCEYFNDYFIKSYLEIMIDTIIPPKNKIEPVNGYVKLNGKKENIQSIENGIGNEWIGWNDWEEINQNNNYKYQRKYNKYKTKYINLKYHKN